MKNITNYLVLIFLLFLAPLAKSQTANPDFLDGSLYLKVDDSSSVVLEPYPGNIPALNLIINLFGLDSIYKAFPSQDPLLNQIYRINFTDTLGVQSLISQLQLLPFVDYAEKIPLHKTTGTTFTPDDVNPLQWQFAKIHAENAWDLTTGSPSVKIAIVDNAIRITHADLAPNIWTNPGETPNNLLDDDLNGYPDDVHGYDAADFDRNPNPPSGLPDTDPFFHGSHCAGIASAATNNGQGIASLGFNCSIIPVKATKDATGGDILTHPYEGVFYAIQAHADVISMSFGAGSSSLTGQRVIQTAANAGIVMIGAAGNSNVSTEFYPAAYPEVLAVGSTNDQDQKSGFSNYGTWVDVMAPGSNIYSCKIASDTAYGLASGTSMACPLVAGLAGLVLSMNPNLTPAQVYDAIKNGCENIDAANPNHIGEIGAGRINAWNTLLSVGTDPEIHPSGYLVAYPNPASQRANFQTNLTSRATWNLHEISGKTLLQGTEILVPNQVTSLDLAGISPGLYLLEVFTEQSRQVTKLVVR
ncbi:MAG: S8 family peptidase [Bacteroidia bacterium]|nr:S8 family peptidase [Bacteroidia bacterium]